MLSEQEILDRGIIKNVPLTLDDGDEHYPSGHWANTSGTRMYREKRVQLAEELIKYYQNGRYYHQHADKINSWSSPVTEAIIVFDYRFILNHINYPLASKLSYYSVPLFRPEEIPYVLQALIELANYSNKKLNLTTQNGLFMYFDAIAQEAEHLYGPPWPDAIVRQPILRHNLFKGKSSKAAHKILQILSLIRNGKILNKTFSTKPYDLIKFLIENPLIRIDHKIQRII
jgi:hypothetical protein